MRVWGPSRYKCCMRPGEQMSLPVETDQLEKKRGPGMGSWEGPALKSWGDAVLAKEVRETVCAIAANRECVSGRNRPPERESTTA